MRPFRHFADFRSRSRRTEFIAYCLLLAFANGLLLTLFDFTYPERRGVVSVAFLIATLVPTVALFVRRMHDEGYSGWWVLLILPRSALGAWQAYISGGDFRLYQSLNHLPSDGVEILAAVGGLCWIAFILMVVQDPEKGGNRYGPDPRRLVPGDPDY